MQLTLKLAVTPGSILPINYQHALSSWIYKVIARADSGYGNFLHEKGYGQQGRQFKMFTFSQLAVQPYEILGDKIKLLGHQASLTIRFAVDLGFTHFIQGLFLNQQLILADHGKAAVLQVAEVHTALAPVFQETMTYRCLSPICISQAQPHGPAQYLAPTAPGYGTLLVANLHRKSTALIPAGESEPEPDTLPPFTFQLLNTPRKKGIHIKDGKTSHTHVISYLFHFTLTAPVSLHQIGYHAGFGGKNSMGFGCVEVVS